MWRGLGILGMHANHRRVIGGFHEGVQWIKSCPLPPCKRDFQHRGRAYDESRNMQGCARRHEVGRCKIYSNIGNAIPSTYPLLGAIWSFP